MDNLTSQIEDLQLQPLEFSPVQVPDVDPDSARSMLECAFSNQVSRSTSCLQLQAARSRVLLKTHVGRDLTLITSEGVQFKIHSVMLLGGPTALESLAFPDGTNTLPSVELPWQFHPILIDRFVDFIYTCYYAFHSNNHTRFEDDTFPLQNATFIPPSWPTGPPGLTHNVYAFHVHMYILASTFGYIPLQDAARNYLTNRLFFRHHRTPGDMWQAVDAVFGLDRAKAGLLSMDEVNILRNMAVVAVLVHQTKWQEAQRQKFKDMTWGAHFADFWHLYDAVVEENGEFIADKELERQLRDELRFRTSAKKEKKLGDSTGAGVRKSGAPSGSKAAKFLPTDGPSAQ